MSAAASPVPWDYALINRMLRERRYQLSVRIEQLMAREQDLQKIMDTTQPVVDQLKCSVAVVDEHGGDSENLRLSLAAHSQPLKLVSEQLSSIRKELQLVRESYKWVSQGYDNTYWLGFAEPELERFDKEHCREQ